MSNRGRDIRFGLRMLARNKGFTLVAILALVLGIGPNVAIFSIVWATFLAPLPYPHPNQLVVLWTHYKGQREGTSADDFAQWAANTHAFQHLDFQSWVGMHLTNPDHSPEDVTGLRTTPGFYTKDFRIRMALGRDFTPHEGTPGNDHLVILTHWLWETHYHSDPAILGKSILIDDEPYTVVGVLQAGPEDRIDGTRFVVPYIPAVGVHTDQYGDVFGRLKPGVSIAQAQAQLSVVEERIARQQHTGAGDNPKFWSTSVESLHNDWLDPNVERNMWLLLAAVGLVLYIACANVANLLLARGAARQQELALRSAVGASRRQVFAQLLTENLTLAMLGGAIGLGLGYGIMKLAMAILPLAKENAEAVVGLNLPVMLFAVGVTLLGGILFGCIPAWQAAGVNLSDVLKQSSRSISGHRRRRTQGILVTTEFAFALTLLAGAGMALHSFYNLSQIDLGVTTQNVLAGWLQENTNGRQHRQVAPAPAQVVSTERQILARVQAVPGVESASLSTGQPLHGYDTLPFTIAGQPADLQHRPVVDLELVTPGFFRTYGVRLVRGRFLNDEDTLAAPPAVVVNKSFVLRYLPNTDPFGHQVLLGFPQPGQNQLGPPKAFQIVGVFHDINNDHLTGPVQPEIIASLWQTPWPGVNLAVRTAVDPGSVTDGVRAALASVAPSLNFTRVETLRQYIDDELVGERFGMVLFGGFAAIALILAALGIYGVMSFVVAQRSHEVGLRMALGAQKSEVVALMVRGGMRLTIPGMILGLIGVFALGRLMHSTLYGVSAVDITSILLVAALLFGVAVLASWVPARRSAEVDPMIALREE